MIDPIDRAARILVAYYSATGHVHALAKVVDEPTASLDDLEWADGIAFGTSTRFGNVAAQLKMLPLGYTVHEVFNGGGNPYGASYTSGTRFGPPDRETTVAAVAQGRRLARVAQVIGVAREHGLLETRARRPATLDESEV
jgi:hypothetical protein